MKIIYEVGDYVELDDNIEVPNDMAAEAVRLIKKVSKKKWEVETCDYGRTGIVHEKWFNPR